MPLIKWKPEYTVNEAELDRHHMTLFDVLNSAYDDVMNSVHLSCVMTLIDELAEFMKAHFAAEEQYMEKLGYQELNEHIGEHRYFLKNIELLKANPYESNLDATKGLIIFLGNWALHHILNEDKKYSSLLGQED